MNSPQAEADGSVCYRHPDRSSWTLCERCGRTICPECQILTPSGVRCPDCVRETGGSVWESTARAKPAKAKKTGLRRQSIASRVDAATRPVLAIGIGATAIVFWLLGFIFPQSTSVLGGLPSEYLNTRPDVAVQVWRYVTTWFVYPAIGGPYVISTLLGIGIFVYIAWNAERSFGWRRFAVLVLVSGTGAAAICGIGLGATAGLVGPVWGIFAAYVIVVWDQPAARNRLLITIAIWFLISLFLGGNLAAMIGGAAAGIGATLLLRHYDGRTRTRPSTPYLILAAGLAGLILLAILSATIIAPLT